ncbi:hypothetical protein [Proteus mirabilis]|uniref:hypothetical protein n=1 Tax=Proteus mirabilis TaxID=584 RepID=UPI001F03C0ED|nr:hypothetical protein [Proteus mirabilis]
MKLFFTLRKLSKIKIIGNAFKVFYKAYCLAYGAAIPLNVYIDKSNKFPHGIHGIFLSKDAKIGVNNTIFHQVTIGSNQIDGHPRNGAPEIGNNCIIGAGAKIIGRVKIADNVNIATNCSVSIDVKKNSTVYHRLDVVTREE